MKLDRALAGLLLAQEVVRSGAGFGPNPGLRLPPAALLEAGSAAGGPWDSITQGTPDIGLRAEQDSHEAMKVSDTAVAAQQESARIAAKNKGILSSLQSSVEAAAESARNAFKAQNLAATLAEEVKEATATKAHEVIEAEIKKAQDAAFDAEKAEAEQRGIAMMEKMIASAPAAAEAAAAPYAEAQERASAIATTYEERADALVGKSQSTQAEGQELLAQAQAWNSLGEFGKANDLFKRSHQKMEKAVGYNAQASSFYDAAKWIKDVNPQYEEEAKAAEYHAIFMHNPDAEPP